MKSAVIIFHSIHGNTLEMAKFYEQAFLDEGFAVALFRIKDDMYESEHIKKMSLPQTAEKLSSIPILKDIELLENYHVVAMGCPVCFSNVSAPMKAFIDSFYYLYDSAYLFGKYFLSFASAQTHADGGIETLQALNRFAMGMGMFPVPVPPKTQFMPSCGCLHFSGPYRDNPPDQSTLLGIRGHVYAVACALTDDSELLSIIDNIEGSNL